MMRIGIAADHGGFDLKTYLRTLLEGEGVEVRDFGASTLNTGDDFPDFVIPLARAVSEGEVDRGIAVCASGVGACVAANKVPGVRAALVEDTFTARQGVEDDDMNVLCLGGLVTGPVLASDLVRSFLGATFKEETRFVRRLQKIKDLEDKEVLK